MTGPVAADAVAGQGQDDTSGFDPVTAHENSTIVQRCIGGKQIEQQLATELGTDRHPGVEKVLRTQITAHIHHDQGTTPLL